MPTMPLRPFVLPLAITLAGLATLFTLPALAGDKLIPLTPAQRTTLRVGTVPWSPMPAPSP